jgi:hypothetical protein
MIEVYLIKDETHYQKPQLDMMERIFVKNFIQHENPNIEKFARPVSPEIRIHIMLLQEMIPEILFKALGEDLYDTIRGGFLNAFVNPISRETPSLVFQFVGSLRSVEFKVTSRDEKTIEEASQKVIEKLLSVLTSEELPQESNSHDTQALSFIYEEGVWR